MTENAKYIELDDAPVSNYVKAAVHAYNAHIESEEFLKNLEAASKPDAKIYLGEPLFSSCWWDDDDC